MGINFNFSSDVVFDTEQKPPPLGMTGAELQSSMMQSVDPSNFMTNLGIIYSGNASIKETDQQVFGFSSALSYNGMENMLQQLSPNPTDSNLNGLMDNLFSWDSSGNQTIKLSDFEDSKGKILTGQDLTTAVIKLLGSNLNKYVTTAEATTIGNDLLNGNQQGAISVLMQSQAGTYINDIVNWLTPRLSMYSQYQTLLTQYQSTNQDAINKTGQSKNIDSLIANTLKNATQMLFYLQSPSNFSKGITKYPDFQTSGNPQLGSEVINATIMGQLFGMIGANPQSFNLTSDQYNNMMSYAHKLNPPNLQSSVFIPQNNSFGTGDESVTITNYLNGLGIPFVKETTFLTVNGQLQIAIKSFQNYGNQSWGTMSQDQINNALQAVKDAYNKFLSDFSGYSGGPDTYFSSFLSSIKTYASADAPPPPTAPNPLDAFISTYYNDTIQPSILTTDTYYTVSGQGQVPKLAQPDFSYIQQQFGVDLNSPANQALYNQVLQQYAQENNLSASQIADIQEASQNSAFNNAWAQETQLKILAQVIAQLAASGQITISASETQAMIASLPPDVQAAIKQMEATAQTSQGALGLGGTNLTPEQLTAVVAAILIAGKTTVSGTQDLMNRATTMNQAVNFNGAMILGATAALNKVLHPDTVDLFNFLAAISKMVLEYRNELLKVIESNANVTQALSIARRDNLDQQSFLIDATIANNQAQINEMVAEEAKLAKEKKEGIGLMIGGGALTLVGAIISLIPGGAAFGIPLMMTGLGLIQTGAFMYEAAMGNDITQKMDQGMQNDLGLSATDVMIILIVATVILTIASGGAGFAAVADDASTIAIAAGTVVAVTAGAAASLCIDIWTVRATQLIARSLEKDGVSSDKAQEEASAICAIMVIAAGCMMNPSSEMSTTASNILKTVGRFAADPVVAMKAAATRLMNTLSQTTVSEAATSALASIKNAFLNFLKGFTGDGGVEGMTNGVIAMAALAQAGIEMSQEIEQAEIDKAESQIMSRMAKIDSAMIILKTAQQLYSQAISSVNSDNQSYTKSMTDLASDFQEAVESLMQAVTAITSNQASPQAAPTGGGAAPGDPASKSASKKKTDLKDIIISGSPTSLSTFTVSDAPVEEEGLESSFMGTTKPKQFFALMMLLRALAKKIANQLKQSGMGEEMAEGQGLKMASNILKSLSMLAKGEMDMGKSAEEALEKSPLLMTLSLLLSQHGVSQKDFDLSQLMQTSPQSNMLDDDTLAAMLQMLEELAKSDPALQELVINFKKLMDKKSSSPAEFSFEILQLFAKTLGMGKADLNGLAAMVGGFDQSLLNELQTSGQQMGELLDEYMLAGTSGSPQENYSV